MEDTMHFPSRWEVEAIGVWGDNLRDFERAFSSRGQFSGREVNFQVMRVEPNLCSYFPRGELCSNLLFHCLSRFSVGSSGLFLSSIERFKSFVNGREECLPDWQISSGFETHHE